MSIGKSLGKIGAYLLGEGLGSLKGTVDSQIEEIKKRVEITVRHATKMIAILLFMMIGAVFILAGLGRYLSETVSGLGNGMGYVLVGSFILFIGIVGRVFSSN